MAHRRCPMQNFVNMLCLSVKNILLHKNGYQQYVYFKRIVGHYLKWLDPHRFYVQIPRLHSGKNWFWWQCSDWDESRCRNMYVFSRFIIFTLSLSVWGQFVVCIYFGILILCAPSVCSHSLCGRSLLHCTICLEHRLSLTMLGYQAQSYLSDHL